MPYDNWSQILPPPEKPGTARDNPSSAKLLSHNAAGLLRAVEENPGIKTTDYYRILKLNDFQGNRAKTELENHRLIEGVELPRLKGAERKIPHETGRP